MSETRECEHSTRETIVADLWAAGWFIRTAKGIVNGYEGLDAHDVAAEAVFTAMRAAESWRESEEHPVVKWVKFRAKNAMLYEVRRWCRINNPLISENIIINAAAERGGNNEVEFNLIDLVASAPSAEEIVIGGEWYLVRPDIERAINALTPKQQIVVRSRMLDDSQRALGKVPSRGTWTGAQKQLRVKLSHLKNLVQNRPRR